MHIQILLLMLQAVPQTSTLSSVQPNLTATQQAFLNEIQRQAEEMRSLTFGNAELRQRNRLLRKRIYSCKRHPEKCKFKQ